MYIKQIIIQGFKSYKEMTALDPFSPKINVIVGANGSGKSNFFSAIRFVLADSFSSMRQEERQQLLHEGAGHAVQSAYVEIVFDNSDGRLPVDRDEVRVRRTIGPRKDEFHLDRKHATKAEVLNLLESAGFSRSNPYYVVQQGKITKMALMKDAERLDLLKEIGGTRLYEERRLESQKIMHETEARKSQIEEIVSSLDAKLKELDEERKELAAYQKADKQRRAVQYLLHDAELREARAALEAVDKRRADLAAESVRHEQEATRAHSDVREAKRELAGLEARREDARQAATAAAARRTDAVEARARKELEVQDMEARLAERAGDAESARAERAELAAAVAAKRAALAEAERAAGEREGEEAACREELAEVSRRLDALYGKQGRGEQFGSAKERDAWIRAEVAAMTETLRKHERALASLEEEVGAKRAELGASEGHLRDLEAKGGEYSASVEGFKADVARLERDRDGLQNTKNKLWRESEEAEKARADADDTLARAAFALEKSVNRDLSQGLNSVKRLVKEHNLRGVRGVLVELLDCQATFHTAVEAAAGNSLMHVVVDDDAVAARVVRLLNECRGGRVTFLPLSRVNPPPTQYPTQYGDSVVPILKVLKYDKEYEGAMRQVFGKTLICKTLDLASRVAREASFNCVTLDGDTASKRGALTGGHRDVRHSKMAAMARMREAEDAVAQLEAQQRERRDQVLAVDQTIADTMGELQKLRVRVERDQAAGAAVARDVERERARGGELQKAIRELERRCVALRAQVVDVRSGVAALEAELGTELRSQLSARERKELAELQPRKEDLARQAVDVAIAAREAAQGAEALRDELERNLERRLREVEQQVAEADVGEASAELEALRAAVKESAAEVRGAEEEERKANKAAAEVAKKIAAVQARLEEIDAREADEEDQERVYREKLDGLMRERAALLVRRDDAARRVRELGALPTDAVEQHRSKHAKQLRETLKKINKDLERFGSVNQKALDQYVSFMEQHDEVRERLKECNQSAAKLAELIATLDQRKEEAILRTFKQVAKNFRDIFAELVAGGRGELVMVKRRAAEDADDDGDAAGAPATSVDQFSGVKVRVSFGAGEVQAMKQLSGGQKTLVALTLIFAIQRCDPGPFYLFDEIDAALDPQYRTSVAAMIRKQAEDDRNPAQFIVTTFNPQLVQVSDQVYGVSHAKRISTVDLVTREDAIQFLQEDEQHDAAGGA
ncbi:unnamed protein product [Pedinophyceae sp. YPF-701]|nr:unnamed protein product [Pedinophyceae sp. YPF-701]